MARRNHTRRLRAVTFPQVRGPGHSGSDRKSKGRPVPEGTYVLGIDIGTSSVVTVICRSGVSAPVTFRADLAAVLSTWSTGRDLDEMGGTDLVPPPSDLLERVGDATPVRVGDRTSGAADVVAGLVRLLVDRAT